MLVSGRFLGSIFHAVKISSSRESSSGIRKLWLNIPKVNYACCRTNYTLLRQFPSLKLRTFLMESSSWRNCHSFVQDAGSEKTPSIEHQITSHNELKEQFPTEKIKIYFETSKGKKIESVACTNQNVMNASIENDIAMHGNCGGEAICSICHVYVDEKYEAFMPKVSEEEAEMLDMVPYFQENSRLSCQIIVRKELEGAVFKLPDNNEPSYGLIDDN